MTAEQLKVAAARAALAEIGPGMTVGLGTGSTAAEFVRLLAESSFAASIRCTSTSEKTEALARSLGIAMFPLHEIAPLDIAVDGADEVDPQLRLIKGRGGALLREKIVEQQARRFVVIADESKVVAKLGRGVLPVEVTPFAVEVLMPRLERMALQPVLRLAGGEPRVTDEGHRIIDVMVPADEEIADVVARIRELAGVVETGFFPTEATLALIASDSGVRRMTRS